MNDPAEAKYQSTMRRLYLTMRRRFRLLLLVLSTTLVAGGLATLPANWPVPAGVGLLLSQAGALLFLALVGEWIYRTVNSLASRPGKAPPEAR